MLTVFGGLDEHRMQKMFSVNLEKITNQCLNKVGFLPSLKLENGTLIDGSWFLVKFGRIDDESNAEATFRVSTQLVQ